MRETHALKDMPEGLPPVPCGKDVGHQRDEVRSVVICRLAVRSGAGEHTAGLAEDAGNLIRTPHTQRFSQDHKKRPRGKRLTDKIPTTLQKNQSKRSNRKKYTHIGCTGRSNGTCCASLCSRYEAPQKPQGAP